MKIKNIGTIKLNNYKGLFNDSEKKEIRKLNINKMLNRSKFKC